jgi:hypothetical protein
MLGSVGDATRLAACVAIGVISYTVALWICWQVAGKPPGAETMMMNRVGQWLRRRASAAKSAA